MTARVKIVFYSMYGHIYRLAEAVARVIHRALYMGPDERRRRMHRLRYLIRKRDVYWWAERFLSHAV
jgi:trehalose-6-phosphate synthase